MQFPQATKGIILFSVLSALGLGLVFWFEVFENTEDSLASTILSILLGMQAVVVVGATYAYFFTEVVDMLAEKFRRYQREEGRREGRREGRKEGVREGEQSLAERLLRMPASERQSEIERIANGNKQA